MEDKIKLFRVLNNITHVFISYSGRLYKNEPNNFTGFFIMFWKNGEKRWEYLIENGVNNGCAVSWWSDGKIQAIDNYKDGKRHGKSMEWNTLGELMNDRLYINGEIVWG